MINDNAAEYACLDRIHVDDCAFALNLGANLALNFFRYSPITTEGSISYERVATASLVIPWSSAFCKYPHLFLSAASLNAPPAEAMWTARLACN